MTLVIDANIAIKWFVRQFNSQLARDIQASESELIAPDLLVAEVANSLWRYTKTQEVTVERALDALAILPSMLSELVPTTALATAAFHLSHTLDCAIYDCLYAALAIERKCGFVTADRKFAERLRTSRRMPRVKLLDAYAR